MRTYVVRHTGDGLCEVQAAAVVFETTHVVFTDERGSIVWAPRAQDVLSVTEDGNTGSVE